MTLFEKLAAATSEEDVKAAYIKALGLKDVQRNLIDIQTKEVWFEAKLGAKHSTYAMFTQLLNYVWVALRDGEEIPPFLRVRRDRPHPDHPRQPEAGLRPLGGDGRSRDHRRRAGRNS